MGWTRRRLNRWWSAGVLLVKQSFWVGAFGKGLSSGVEVATTTRVSVRELSTIALGLVHISRGSRSSFFAPGVNSVQLHWVHALYVLRKEVAVAGLVLDELVWWRARLVEYNFSLLLCVCGKQHQPMLTQSKHGTWCRTLHRSSSFEYNPQGLASMANKAN